MIGDHAARLAAQQAVSNHGTDADQSYSALHTVLCELRKAGVSLTLNATRHPVSEPRARPVARLGRYRRSVPPSPHPADAVTQNRRAFADIACVALDTDTTSWYSMRHRLVERGAVCCLLDSQEFTTFPRCIDPERPKPQMFNRFTASPIAWSRVNPRLRMSSHRFSSPGHFRHDALGQ